MSNKLVAITMVKNEADVIESFVRHTLLLADMLLIVDHQSTDDTPKILASLSAEGLPLKVEMFYDVAHRQSEVMTALMYRAITDEKADIVLPLDADEFLLHDDGDSNLLRQRLRKLDVGQVYNIPWVNYALVSPADGRGDYLLSRPCRKKRQKDDLPKVIVGREAALARKLYLAQGNHYALPVDSDRQSWHIFGEATELSMVHLAHFPYRSSAQKLSKALCGWLANVAKYSEYTLFASQWMDDFVNFVHGGGRRQN